MKKILMPVVLGLAIFTLSCPAKAGDCHHKNWQNEVREPAASANPYGQPVALSAETITSGNYAEPEQRDTRHDWQERIRQNRDRYND